MSICPLNFALPKNKVFKKRIKLTILLKNNFCERELIGRCLKYFLL